MKLIFLNDELQGQVRESEESCITIGSDKGNVIRLDIPGISGKHARLEEIDGQWVIVDDGSKNGVQLNGEKLVGQANLSSGDIIKLAHTVKFKVEFETVANASHHEPSLEDLLFQGEEKKESLSEIPLEDLPRLSPKTHESDGTDKSGKVESKASKKSRIKTDENGAELRKQLREKRLKKERMGRIKAFVFLTAIIAFGCVYGPQIKDQVEESRESDTAQAKTAPLEQEIKAELSQQSKEAEQKQDETIELKAREPVELKEEVPYVPLNDELDIEIASSDSSSSKPKASKVAHKPLPMSVLQRDAIYNFSQKYCARCHDDKKQKGDFNFEHVDFAFSTHDSIYHWQDILDVLNTGEMPPEDVKQPNADELSDVIGEITDKLQVARIKLAATGGLITMRHLNRREYSGSIQNLFHADLPTDALPTDIPEGLDTNGKEQFFTSNHYFMYYNTATEIAKFAIKGLERKSSSGDVQRLDPEIKNNGNANQWVQKFGKGKLNIEDYRGLSPEDLKKRLMTEYEGKIGRIILPRDVAYLLDENHKHAASGRVLAHFRLVPGYKYRINVYSFGNTKQSVPLKFESGLHNNYVADIEFDTGKELLKTSFEFTANLLQDKVGFRIDAPKGCYVDYIELESLETETSPFEKIFGEMLHAKNIDTSAVRAGLKDFSELAFRGTKVESSFLKSLEEIYEQHLAKGKSFKEAIVAPLATILTAPSFLYIKEYNNGRRQALNQEEFATRMSYFLWGTPADEELLAAAKTGKLRSNSGLSKQVDRLLSSNKNELAMNDFFRQWLELDRLDIVALPHELKKGQFNESVREEPLKFFNFVIDRNLPVENLIDSKYAVVDQTMADYYGFEGDFQGFTPIELPEGSPRGGVLTQAAFLMMGTSGPRTSPTIRGTVIRSKFLYDPAPPPPPNVPQLETKDDGTPRTVRELVDMHKEVSQCKSCHEKIDPVGYGLESFDYLAKHRDEVKILQKQGRRLKVVKTAELIEDGYLNDRSSFNDLKGFKQALLEEKDQLARSIFENMLSYGIGRKIEFIDKREIDMILNRLKRKNYPMKAMIAEVINSKIFRTK